MKMKQRVFVGSVLEKRKEGAKMKNTLEYEVRNKRSLEAAKLIANEIRSGNLSGNELQEVTQYFHDLCQQHDQEWHNPAMYV